MFGHQDDSLKISQPVEPVANGTLSNDNPTSTTTIAPTTVPIITPVTPSAPVIDNTMASDYIMTNAPNASGDTTPTVVPIHTTDDLLNIKQQALHQLSPLVGHLDQTAEEKFRTTMMMIQASDDQSLIGTAYESAKQITDEKVRAQALLDVVNEINYFTQHQADKTEAA